MFLIIANLADELWQKSSASLRRQFTILFAAKRIKNSIDNGTPSSYRNSSYPRPITLILAVILPGNNVLPFGDLATIPFIVAMIVVAARGNIVHSVLAGTIVIGMLLYMSTALAEAMTNMAIIGKFNMPEGAAMISSIDQGGNPINFVIYEVFKIFS